MKNKKYIYVILICLLVLLLGCIGIFAYFRNKDGKIEVENFVVSNLTDTGAVVSWYTSEPTESVVVVKEKEGGVDVFLPIVSPLSMEKFYDDRDMEQDEDGVYVLKEGGQTKRYTHHVSLRGLDPEKEYTVGVAGKVSVIRRDSEEDEFPSFTTLSIMDDLSTPDPVYSRVLSLDEGVDDPVDGIVYYSLTNPGEEYSVTSALYSTTLNENSSWAGDLAGVRMNSGEKFVRKEDGTYIILYVITEDGNKETNYLLGDYQPLPSIFVGQEENSAVIMEGELQGNFMTKVSAETDEQCAELGKCGAGGACYDVGWCCADNTDKGESYICSASGWQKVSDDISPDSKANYDKAVEELQKCKKNGDADSVVKCTENYKEMCNAGDGTLGLRTCHKEGTGPCGASGPTCSWDPAKSYCGECKADTSLNVSDKELLEKLEDESKKLAEVSRTTHSGSGGSEASGVSDEGGVATINNLAICNQINEGRIDNAEEYNKYKNTQMLIVSDESKVMENRDFEQMKSLCNIEERGEISTGINICKVTEYNGSTEEHTYYSFSNGKRLDEVKNADSLIEEVYKGADNVPSCPLEGSEEESATAEGVTELDEGENNLPNNTGDGKCRDDKLGIVTNAPCYTCDGSLSGTNDYKYTDEGSTCEKTRVTRDAADCNKSCSFEASSLNYNPMKSVSAQTDTSVADTTETEESEDLSVDVSGGYSVLDASGETEVKIGEFAVNMDKYKRVDVKLYYDTNANGKKDANEEYFDTVRNIKLRKDSEAATYELEVGWNLIALPIASSEGIDTASELLEHFNDQGADILHVAKYTDSGFVMYTQREDSPDFANDFDLVPGEGYFVLNYEAADVSITGNKFDEAVPFKVHNGWNLVGVYTNEQDYTAEELLKDMEDENISADTVSKYESGIYNSLVYQDDLVYGNDYNIYERTGYFIRVASGGGDDITFTPKPGD